MLQNVRKFLPGRRPHVTQSGHQAHRATRPPQMARVSRRRG